MAAAARTILRKHGLGDNTTTHLTWDDLESRQLLWSPPPMVWHRGISRGWHGASQGCQVSGSWARAASLRSWVLL